MGSIPWVGKIPWRRKWPLTPVFLPGGKIHTHTHTHTHTHGICTKLQEKFFKNLIKLECFWLAKYKKYYLDSNFRCFHLLVMVVWLPWVSYFLLSLSLPTKIYYRWWKKENSKVKGYYFCILPEPSYASITDGWNLPQTSVLCPY